MFAILNAIKQLELAEGIPEKFLLPICEEALAEDKLTDTQWLEHKLTSVRTEMLLKPEEDEKDPLSLIEASLPKQVDSMQELTELIRQHEVWINSVLDPDKKISGGRANLQGADLSGYDLNGVNLSCATLTDSKMVGTLLRGANLSRARLENADLQGADLTGARLKKANLQGADLREADLTDAYLEGAILKGTLLETEKKRPESLPNPMFSPAAQAEL